MSEEIKLEGYNEGYGNTLHRGRQDGEFAGHPPMYKLQYMYKYPMSTMFSAYLNKYTWEPKFSLTTIAGVEQSGDKIVYMRRSDNINLPDPTYERVTIDRATNTMTAECLGMNTDGTEAVIQKHAFREMSKEEVPENEGPRVLNVWHVFQAADKSFKVDQFKKGIVSTIQAIKFAQYDAAKNESE